MRPTAPLPRSEDMPMPTHTPHTPVDGPPSAMAARFAEWQTALADANDPVVPDITPAQCDRMTKSLLRLAAVRAAGVADVLAKLRVVSYETGSFGDAATAVFNSALADLARMAGVALPTAETPHHPMTTRATLEAETRAMCLKLGALWVRSNGSPKYGKATLANVTDADLSEIHAAGVAAVAVAARRALPDIRAQLRAATTAAEVEAIRIQRGYSAGWTEAVMAHKGGRRPDELATAAPPGNHHCPDSPAS
jgi:hypothetical protein